jgi:hypothetical protein
MSPDVRKLLGLVYIDPDSTSEFGVFRECDGSSSIDYAGSSWAAWAEDGCGNAFLVSSTGSIGFRDHETDRIETLAADWSTFVRGCTKPSDVELQPGQVESVWIDPELAKEHWIDVDSDGRRRVL